MIQVPFFTGMMEASHGAVVWLCTRAAIGDANIALFAYGIAAAATKESLINSDLRITGVDQLNF